MKKKLDQGLIFEDWLRIARRDWERVRRNLNDQDPEAAGFFFQQSLEKYLKAFLLQHGWKLIKIHELDALLDEAIKHNSNLQTFYELCERVSGYYLADRYPSLGASDLTCEDIKRDLKEALKLICTIFPGEKLSA